MMRLTLDGGSSASDWTALSNDTTGIIDVAYGVIGKSTIRFNKVDGSDNATYGGIYRTIGRDISGQLFPGQYAVWHCYCPDVTNVASAFLRIGSSTSDYCEYRVADTALNDGLWTYCKVRLGEPSAVAGAGFVENEVSYIAQGLNFDAETNALAGIGVGPVYIVGVKYDA